MSDEDDENVSNSIGSTVEEGSSVERDILFLIVFCLILFDSGCSSRRKKKEFGDKETSFFLPLLVRLAEECRLTA